MVYSSHWYTRNPKSREASSVWLSRGSRGEEEEEGKEEGGEEDEEEPAEDCTATAG